MRLELGNRKMKWLCLCYQQGEQPCISISHPKLRSLTTGLTDNMVTRIRHLNSWKVDSLGHSFSNFTTLWSICSPVQSSSDITGFQERERGCSMTTLTFGKWGLLNAITDFRERGLLCQRSAIPLYLTVPSKN